MDFLRKPFKPFISFRINSQTSHILHTLFSVIIICPTFWISTILLTICILILRTLIQLTLWFLYYGKYHLMSPSDATFGHKCVGNNSIIHAITVHKGRPNLESIRARYDQVVFQYNFGIYRKLMRVVSNKWNFPCWRFPDQFDICDHVRLATSPQDVISEGKLMTLLGQLIDQRMSEKKPQWEHLIVPCYLIPNSGECHFVSIYRIHHAYSDGVSFSLLLDSVLTDRKLKFAIDPMKKLAGTNWFKDLYLLANAAIFGPARFLHDLRMGMKESSLLYLDRYSCKKLVGWSEPVDLEVLKGIKDLCGCSIPSVLMTAVTGAIRKYHVRKFSWFNSGVVPEDISCANMCAMLPFKENRLQNRFTPFRIVYPLREQDCRKRLNLTDRVGREVSCSGQPYFNFFVIRVAGCFPQAVQDFLSRIAGTPLVFSNVPGPMNVYRMFGGEVVDHGVWLPPLGRFGIGICSFGYNGKIRLCISSDSQLFEDQKEIDQLLHDFDKEILEIASNYVKNSKKIC